MGEPGSSGISMPAYMVRLVLRPADAVRDDLRSAGGPCWFMLEPA